MAITAEQRNDIVSLLVGMFDAAPTAELLTQFIEAAEAGQSIEELAASLGTTDEFQSLYPVWLTNEEFAAKFAKNLLGENNVSDAIMTEAVDFVVAQLQGGASIGETVQIAVSALSAVPTDDADWGQAAQQLANKVEVATYFAINKDLPAATLAQLQSIIADVSAEAESVTAAKILIDADLSSTTQRLTVDQDILTGSAGNDMFLATYFDNQNTLQSGDFIEGGAGRDTLVAKIGNSADFAINVETESVEVASFQAQAVANDSTDNEIPGHVPAATAGGNDANNASSVDAQDMNGTEEFWSVNSRADLVIEDVRHNSHETTLGFRDADAGDIDYAVYFDSQHITAPDSETDSQLFLELLDLEAAAATGDKLTNNPYVGVQITVDGNQYDIVGDAAITTTYQDLVDALNAALDAEGLDNVEASLGEDFRKFNSDDGLQYTGTTIVLTSNDGAVLGGNGWIAESIVPADTNVHTAINNTVTVTDNLTQVDMILDNVGRGSQSGDFLAGNMSTGNSGSNGIQQFNVQVQQDSWISSLATTANDLEVVNVEHYEGYADKESSLRIGNTDGQTGLEDVRIFNASTMQDDVIVRADLDADIIDKYDNLVDTQNGVENDNIQFNYTTGAGEDEIELTVSQEAIAYEDQEITVETGAGNDKIHFEAYDVTGELDTNWEVDQAELDNIVLSTGAGDDEVRAFGDGEVTITTAAGNDVVYSDNSGTTNANNDEVATWLFNADNVDLEDIDGSGVSNDFFLLNGKVTVTFSAGTNITDGGGVTQDAAAEYTNGFEGTADISLVDYVGNNTDINQAIKDAINNDATLSKMLVAEDGPNNSVVVKALVDGEYLLDDLTVTVSQDAFPGVVSASVQDAWEAFVGDSANTYVVGDHTAQLTAAQTSGTGFNGTSVLGQIAAADQTGVRSDEFANDNVINVGTGNDVVVLSTHEESNETLVLTGYDQGNVDVLNFTTGTVIADTSADMLDFSAYLNTEISTSGSADSASDVATTLVNGAVNGVSVITFDNTGPVSETFAGLTAANLLPAINNDAATYGNLGDASLDAAAALGVGGAGQYTTDSRDHVVLIENADNLGEYKVFHLTSSDAAQAGATDDDFATAMLIGVIDLGGSDTGAGTGAAFAIDNFIG